MRTGRLIAFAIALAVKSEHRSSSMDSVDTSSSSMGSAGAIHANGHASAPGYRETFWVACYVGFVASRAGSANDER